MSKYLILTENDESKWDDQTGIVYHFPSRYLNIVTSGTEFVYYKGKMKNSDYRHMRLSSDPRPHYFGKGVIGEVVKDTTSKSHFFAEIRGYHEFDEAVHFKVNGEYIEPLAAEKDFYFQPGVREISFTVYQQILSLATMNLVQEEEVMYTVSHGSDFESKEEGQKKKRYTSYYERNPINRQNAIEFHGLRCVVCKLNFEETYGELGKGFIHIHHVKPISTRDTTYFPDIENDFAALCPNCHAMVHRPKDRTLSVEDLKKIYEDNSER